VQDGGTVVQINDFATLNTQGKIGNPPDSASFTRSSGRHKLGSGIWIRENWGNFEFDYLYSDGMHLLPTEQNPDNKHLQRLRSLIKENITLDINVEGPLTVSVRRFKGDQRLVLHLVNYDYDHIQDIFTPSGPVMIEINKQGLEINKAVLYDIENRLVEEIPFEEKGDKIVLTIANVEVYSIIELK